MMSKQQQMIFDLLCEKSIAYNPGLVKALGSVNIAIFIGQLLYWQGKGRYDEWIYKTVADFEEETGLSRSEQETVIKRCKVIGLLEVKRKGIPPVRHFRIYIPLIIDLIKESQSLKSSKSIKRNNGNKIAQTPPYNTESTSEKTSYNRLKNQNDFLLRKRKELSDSKQIG